MGCDDWAVHVAHWCLGVRFLDSIGGSMADGFGRLPVSFHGLTVCDDWEMHVASWCLGVRGLKEWVLEGMMVQFDAQG